MPPPPVIVVNMPATDTPVPVPMPFPSTSYPFQQQRTTSSRSSSQDHGNPRRRRTSDSGSSSSDMTQGYSRPQYGSASRIVVSDGSRHQQQQEEMRKREEEILRRRTEAKRLQEQEAIARRQREAEKAARAARQGLAGPSPGGQAAFPGQTAPSSSVYDSPQSILSPLMLLPSTINYSHQQQQAPTSSTVNYPQQRQQLKQPSSTRNYPEQQHTDGIDNERTPDVPTLPPVPLPHSAGPHPRRGGASHSAPESARYHNHPSAYSPRDRLYNDDGPEEEYIDELGLSGDNSVRHSPIRLPSWSREEDHETDKEEEERKGREEEETGKRKEDGSKRKEAEDTRHGFQDWDASGSYSEERNSLLSSSILGFTFADCFGHIYRDSLTTTKSISVALLPPPDDSVPHSESIQERLCRLDEMDLSGSRILLLEKIHQEMWAELPTIGTIKWDDLPWPVFVRTTCPEDLMLHRIVSYLLQISSGIDIKEALVDSRRLQWAQQRLRILLRHWGQPGLQKKVENSADKTIVQGVNVVTNHLEIVLDFVNMHQIDEKRPTHLTTIISQTFLKHVGGNLARILTNTSDNSGYKSLLRLKGNSAQKMLNFLQTLLDCSELVSLPRNDILGALLRLSKLSKLYPECLTVTDLERDNYMVDSGHFGEIYKGRSRNQAICLKIIKINGKTQIKHLLKAVFKEALLWGHLSHPNILPFYGIHHLEDAHGRISFVSPWMENGNITEYLRRHPHANRLLLIWDIILGVQFLHENQVIHGDLKGLNVLVNRSGRGCLADFGLANLADEDILRWTSIQTTGHQSNGTLRWQAPELIDPPSEESAKATPASDIYSFACVCYEIYTGHIPFHRITRDITVMKKVIDGSRPPRPAGTTFLSDEIWKVIEMCWNQQPQGRPSANSVIEQLPLAGIVDDRPSGDDHLAPSDFRAAGPGSLGVVFDLAAIDVILSSVLRSTRKMKLNHMPPYI
ncbi:uncharacterized protein LACBIDRAFT_299574 [Laccaria bicolor S238N-H82]|uniref:Predicted protein n=1 Tax=Laccaria bicolor (strain S238N-H82 / ATCC MYA-4686) TaxID=486041 RepID=B0DEW4_LACBS|nr:uncharacterized protein LACBIDRAFT_299574 [Laccaria bicolor S238N-H82]EDR06616.1 predicted protein [Laccaria bicolor S238N-H82]|eukprot:XP_001882463.1 predicted protein [Laccaria bicolor S238N-H82]